LEGDVNGVIVFLYLIDKPGEGHNGRLNDKGLDVNIQERRS
jgi:hypothetical protein